MRRPATLTAALKRGLLVGLVIWLAAALPFIGVEVVDHLICHAAIVREK